MKIHLVGGAVRDLLLGRAVTDRDYLVTGAAPEEFLARHPGACKAGKAFPVYLYQGCEYAWPRGETVEDDLAGRDLTINALALDASPGCVGELRMHPQALSDLKHGILRPASATSLADDPVRAFRAARFAAALPDFSPHPSLLQQMRALAASGALAKIASERVCAETRKALAAPRPGRFLDLLHHGNCLSPWFEELANADAIPAGPPGYHDKSVLGHIRRVMDKLAGDEPAVWMGLCHDLGKTLTPESEWPHHHGHDKRGAAQARRLGARLGLPNRFIKAGELAASLHMKAARYAELRPGSKTDLLLPLHKYNLRELLFKLVAADQNHDYLEDSRRDLDALLAVHLPEEDQNQGAASGEKLRLLRCEALATAQKNRVAHDSLKEDHF